MMGIIYAIVGLLPEIFQELAQRYGIIAQIAGILLVFVAPIVSILIELCETIVLLTANSKDDELVAKVKAIWAKVLPVFELLPHVNVPIAPVFAKILLLVGKGAKALIAGAKAWKSG